MALHDLGANLRGLAGSCVESASEQNQHRMFDYNRPWVRPSSPGTTAGDRLARICYSGGMIVGSGVDLCEVPRIREAIKRHGTRFIERVFTPVEIKYAESKANKFERFAARFAAKEAGMKALGTGWRGGVTWRDFEVVNLPSGRPTLRFHGKAAEIAGRL